MLTELFGENCIRAKVFDLLLSHPYTEYTKSDIAECAGISRTTLGKFIDKLVEYEIIKPTRQIGNGQLYQINMDSTITQALNSFQNQLADIELEKEMKIYKEEIDAEIGPIRPFEEIIKEEMVEKERIEKLEENISTPASNIFFNSTMDISNKPFNNIFEQSHATGAIITHNLGSVSSKKHPSMSTKGIRAQSFIKTTEN